MTQSLRPAKGSGRRAGVPAKIVYTDRVYRADPELVESNEALYGNADERRKAQNAKKRRGHQEARVKAHEKQKGTYAPGTWIKRAKERHELKKRFPEMDVHAPVRYAPSWAERDQKDPYELTED